MINCVAASYSLDMLFTSNQHFPENKTPTILRKTTRIGNVSVYQNKSPTKEEKYLSCLRVLASRTLRVFLSVYQVLRSVKNTKV